jgi:ribosomal protein S25
VQVAQAIHVGHGVDGGRHKIRLAFKFPEQDNVVRIRDTVQEDCIVTVRILADALNISKSTCHQILQEDLSKQKLNARLVPHALIQDQKEV